MARSVIALAMDENDYQSDIRAVNIALQLNALQKRPMGHLIIEIRDFKTGGHIKRITKGAIETSLVSDVGSRLIPQCALESGLAEVILIIRFFI